MKRLRNLEVKEVKLDQKPLTAMELDNEAQQLCVNFVTGGRLEWSGARKQVPHRNRTSS